MQTAGFASAVRLAVQPARARASLGARAATCVATSPPRQRGNGGRGSRSKGVRTGARRAAENAPVRRERLAETAAAARAARSAAAAERRSGGVRRALSELLVGERIKGRVRNLVRHGAYVDVGAEKDGLVHVREMSVEFVYSPGDVVREGQEVDVWVKYVDPVRRVLGLSMVPVAGKWGYEGRTRIADLEVGVRAEGVVARVTNYGAYVDIGAERLAFLHVSGMWGRRPRETLEELRLGRKVWVHVVEVDEVKSFIKLRARGRKADEPLEEHGELGEADSALEGLGAAEQVVSVGAAGIGAGVAATAFVAADTSVGSELMESMARSVLTPKRVLQRFGQEVEEDEDEEDEDEEDDDELRAGEEDEDEDDEDEFDAYEMDFEQDVLARFRPSSEAAYAHLNVADVDQDEEEVVDEGAVEVDGADEVGGNLSEEWSDPTEYTSKFAHF